MEVVEKVRERLGNHGHTWEDLWKDSLTPWDLGKPTPALQSELENYWQENTNQISLRTLVPGCGSGYDLITIACHHDNLIASGKIKHASIVGLDISESSLERAAAELEEAGEFCPFDRPTRVDLVQGDYFDTSTWQEKYSFCGDDDCVSDCSLEGPFDFIYDYTFFCALPPSLRKDWGTQTARLLVPGTGRLLTLIFPILPDAEMKGPPYPVAVEDYQQVLEPNHVAMESEPRENPDTVPQRQGMELACWWRRSKDPQSKL